MMRSFGESIISGLLSAFRTLLICSIAFVATPAYSQSGSVFTPPPGSGERKAILDAARSGNERYTVQAMRAMLTDAGGSAYVEADAGGASAISALLVRDPTGSWTPLVIMSDGSQTCGPEMQARFREIGAAISRHGGDVDRLMPGFSELVETIGEEAGSDCLPDVDFPYAAN